MAFEQIDNGAAYGVPFAHALDAASGLQVPMVMVTNPGGGGDVTAPDREFVLTDYRVKTAFTGAAVGDFIRSVEVWNVEGTTATQVGTTVWRNITAGTVLGSAPSIANLEPNGTTDNSLTNAQLRASAVPVSGPVTDTQLRASRVPVEVLGRPATSRQLAATASSARQAITAGILRVSIVARLANCRFALGDGTVVANAATSHYIGMGERLDIAVTSAQNIAAIRETAATVDGVLEITELA